MKRKLVLGLSALLVILAFSVGIGAVFMTGEHRAERQSTVNQTASRPTPQEIVVQASKAPETNPNEIYTSMAEESKRINRLPQWLAEGYAKELRKMLEAPNTVIGYVNGRPIYLHDFLLIQANENLVYNQGISLMAQNDERVYSQTTERTKDQMVDETIRGEVIRQEAERLGITEDEKEIREVAEMQSLAPWLEYEPKFLNTVLQILGFTKDEYIKEIGMSPARNAWAAAESSLKLYPEIEDEGERMQKYWAHLEEVIKKSEIKKLPF